MRAHPHGFGGLGLKRMKNLALAVAMTIIGASSALADESDDAFDAIATMAAATVCKISVSEEAKGAFMEKY